jgi:hypothetical protein
MSLYGNPYSSHLNSEWLIGDWTHSSYLYATDITPHLIWL